MSGGLRFRAEAVPFAGPATNFTVATKTFAASNTTIIVPTTALTGVQRPGIYRVCLIAAGATTFQFQDTSAGILSAVYNLAAAGSQFIIGDGAMNGDPLWQPSGPGLGLQIVVGAAAIVGDIWTALGA
jgi:hypothetical protein